MTRTISAYLPAPLTSLVGREGEITAITALLHSGPRLISLTGPGGVGKTRLALRLAADLQGDARFSDGVAFVELAAVRDPDQVVATIAQALGLRLSSRDPAMTVLTADLRAKNLLLVLDNFEQVIAAGPRIADILRVCPGLTALVTSRSLLHISGEFSFVVPPLSLPDQDGVGASDMASEHVATGHPSEAVRLFLERARATGASFPLTPVDVDAVTKICWRLDGLPLAIELAAARSAFLPPPVLLARLEQRLPHLTSGPRDAPARHQTMRDAIAWSYSLLSPTEQTVFRHLGVFVGGGTLEAAESVCGPRAEGGGRQANDVDDLPAVRRPPSAPVAEAIESLIHQSLLRVADAASGDSGLGSIRVVMLETIREFALEQLELSDEAAIVRGAHARWYLNLAEEADAAYRTRSDHLRWLARLQIEHANFRAALAWLRDSGESEMLVQLAGALRQFWYFRGHFNEGRSWLARALESPTSGPPAVRARALQIAGMLAHYQGDSQQAAPLLEESLSLWRVADDPFGTAFTLLLLGITAEDRGDYGRAVPFFAEALGLFEAESRGTWEANTRVHLGIVALGQGDVATATTRGEQGRDQFRREGDAWGVVMSLDFLGLVAVEAGDLARAASCFAEALPLVRQLGNPESLVRCLVGVATLAAAADRAGDAARLFGAVAAMAEVIGLAFDLPERAIHERATESARERLGEAVFAAAWAAGRTLSRDAAVAEALAFVAAPLATLRTPLTPRETDVLRLLATDLTVPAIAATLFLSVRTVENHVARILAKLGVRSRSAAVTAARESGLL